MSFEDMLESMRKLGTMPEDVARAAVPLVDAAAKRTAAAGTAPDGTPWVAKKDGSRALENAADGLSTKALGKLVTVTLSGPAVFHNYGAGHSPRRQVLPDGGAGIPDHIAKALSTAAGEVFEKATRGR